MDLLQRRIVDPTQRRIFVGKGRHHGPPRQFGVARIEATLGVKLFERLADGYRPTDEARLIAEKAAEMQNAELAMLRQIAGRDETLTGRLTVTAPQLLIAHVLLPALANFTAEHPDVELDMRATNDLLDLSRREADLAVRVSNAPGDMLKGQRLTRQHTASFASRNLAARIAADPDAPIDWIVYAPYGKLPAGISERNPQSRIRYRFDDMIAIFGAVEAGLGVARLPMFLGRSSDDVVQVPILPPQDYADIWVVGHPDVWPSAKAAAFRQVLKAQFREIAPVFTAASTIAAPPVAD